MPGGAEALMEEAELHDKALRIYALLAAAGRPMSVREIQRQLGLSSPSLAHYHLRKLERLGLLAKDERGQYYVRRLVKIGVLEAFFALGRRLVPKCLFYAVFFSVLLVFCALAFWNTTEPGLLFLALVSLALAALSWAHEAWRVWRRLPG